jgi:hypothetical protein
MGIKMSFISLYKHTYKPYWNCGSLDVRYGLHFEICYGPKYPDETYFLEQFDAHLAKADKEDGAIFSVYTHPGRIATAQHWDTVYGRGKNPDISEALPPPLWKEGSLQVHKDRVRRILDNLQARKDIEITSVADIWNDYKDRDTAKPLENLLKEHNLKPGQEGQLPLKPRSETDAFHGKNMDFEYNWIPHLEGFNPANVHKQIQGLAWTTAET